jgi:hypothetical protein
MTRSTLTFDPGASVPGEESASVAALGDAQVWRRLVAQLSRQSVAKHFDAFEDIDWDAPQNAIRTDDPRFELLPEDPLGATQWYRALPQSRRAQIGLEVFITLMKVGQQFENTLQRGLLRYAFDLPAGAIEYRYVMHEVIEESQHSLMFHEFVGRAGLPAGELAPWMKRVAHRIVDLSRRFPELFFLFVLAGEDPIDFVQREALRSGQFAHPLLRRISQIHVTEEARHISFARAYLRRNVPQLGRGARLRLALRAPLLFGVMTRIMLDPNPMLIARHEIPPVVLREARRSARARQRRSAALAKPHALCEELGLVSHWSERLWRRQGFGPRAFPATSGSA